MEMRKVDTWLESTREYALKRRERNMTKPEFVCCRAVFMSTMSSLHWTSAAQREHRGDSGRSAASSLRWSWVGSVTDRGPAGLYYHHAADSWQEPTNNICLSLISNASCYLSDQRFSFHQNLRLSRFPVWSCAELYQQGQNHTRRGFS